MEYQRETHVPTASAQEEKHPRIQGSHGDKERPQGSLSPEGQRSSTVDGQRQHVIQRKVVKPARQSLKKGDILRGYEAFSRTISSGRSFQRGPIRCFYIRKPDGRVQVRTGFSVSRNLRTAASRNRVRRWMRESYRLQKSSLGGTPTPLAGSFDVVFLFSVRSTPVLDRRVRESIGQAISSLLKELQLRFSESS